MATKPATSRHFLNRSIIKLDGPFEECLSRGVRCPNWYHVQTQIPDQKKTMAILADGHLLEAKAFWRMRSAAPAAAVKIPTGKNQVLPLLWRNFLIDIGEGQLLVARDVTQGIELHVALFHTMQTWCGW